MADTKRVIIGSETDDSLKLELDELGILSKTTLPVSLYDNNGSQITDFGGIGTASSVGQGQGIVTTAGTPVRLSAVSVACRRVMITSDVGNGDLDQNEAVVICVGSSSVIAATATRTGVPLLPTQRESFLINNLNLLYINSTHDGAKFQYYYEN